MPKSPMVTGTKLMPESSEMNPKFRRCSPVIVSNPTAASSSPSASIARLFIGASAPSPMRVANESTNTAKSSAGPNWSAFSAIGSAKNVNRIVETSAPRKEDTNELASARPGRPRRLARGNPSNSSTTAHGSPGMLKRIDVMTPPKSAPQ